MIIRKYLELGSFAIIYLLAVVSVQASYAETSVQGMQFDDGFIHGNWMYVPGDSQDRGSQGFSNSEFERSAYSEFSLNRRTINGELHIASAFREKEGAHQLGFSFNSLRLDLFNGYGKTVTGIRNQYSSMDSYLFHGGINQGYDYSGFSIGNDFPGNVNVNFTQVKVTSGGLEDRVAYAIGLAGKNIDLTVIDVYRSASRVGSAYSMSTYYSGHRIGYDFLQQENGASYQSINYSRVRKGINYQISFQEMENPLYTAKNENRVVFSLGFGFGKKPNRLYASEEQQQGSNRTPYLIGAGAVGAALILSSGSSSSDNAVRTTSQHDAARQVLNEINPVSVAQNLEYGGYIFRNADGSYSNTPPVRGGPASVLLPPPVPGSTATYHTHAAFDPRYDNENFSPTDIATNNALGFDGYLGTPAGAFKYHQQSTGQIFTLGTIAN